MECLTSTTFKKHFAKAIFYREAILKQNICLYFITVSNDSSEQIPDDHVKQTGYTQKKQRTNDFNDKNSSCVAVLIGPFLKFSNKTFF